MDWVSSFFAITRRKGAGGVEKNSMMDTSAGIAERYEAMSFHSRSILGLLLMLAWQTSMAQAAKAPVDFKLMEDSIRIAAERMWSSEDASERKANSILVKSLLERTLGSPHSFEYPFDSLKFVSIQQDPREAFRVFTWQVDLGQGRYQRHGYIQTGGHNARVIALNDSSDVVLRPEAHSAGKEEWVGMVYYRIIPFKSKGEPLWLLFGFANKDGYTIRKMIDVLRFDDRGDPVFGAPVFEFSADNSGLPPSRFRFLLEYDARSKVKLNWDESMDMILYDHLMPFADDRSGGNVVFVPDGTYEGFKLAKGTWKHIPKLEIKAMDEAPVDFPVLDGRKGKDLFGKDRR